MSTTTFKPLLVSVVGPTAVGKTSLAIKLARQFDTEIVSADSRQCFKELEIGTAKPNLQELAAVPHHFINSHSIAQMYSAGEYGREAVQLIEKLHERHKVVIAVGGSTLYLKALWEGFDEMPPIDPLVRQMLNEEFEKNGIHELLEELKEKDPEYFEVVDRKNGQRIIRALEVIRSSNQPFSSFRSAKNNPRPYQNLKIGLAMERDQLFHRINKRMDMMIDQGLFEEAEKVKDFENHNALQTVGYQEIFGFLKGEYDRSEAIRLLKRNSRRYAKRQMTWFRKYDDIHWFDSTQEKEIIGLVNSHLN